MNIRNISVPRFSLISICIHWLMVLQLTAVYACVELHELFPKGSSLHQGLKSWHFMLGLSVLVLVSLRLIARLFSPVPDIEPAPPGWQKLSAKLLHVLLYILMICMPLLGWTLLSAAGKPIPFFGLQLPALIGENKDLVKFLKELHGIGGNVGYFIIALHALAALFHHYVVRDNTLTRMLPNRSGLT